MTEKMIRAKKPKKCPLCKHSPLQLCILGYPSVEDWNNPKYHCLGCIPAPPDENGYGDPKWACPKCDLLIWKKLTLKSREQL
tara:strand:+ start:355 stop:600 length:246 start_codon:yes stop_codon:yes gene_type:complete